MGITYGGVGGMSSVMFNTTEGNAPCCIAAGKALRDPAPSTISACGSGKSFRELDS